jgi:NitT/TauT family transport system permease protein/sulfonate transport system permease protein
VVHLSSASSEPVVSAPARPPRVGGWTAHTLSFLSLIGWGVAALHLPDYLLPGPIEVARQILHLLGSPDFLLDASFSILHIVGSIAVAFVFGLSLALLTHFVLVVRTAIYGRLNPFLASFSTIGWVFLAVIWFGLNDFTVMFVVAMTLMPFALSNLRAALVELDKEMIEMGRSFGRGRARLVRLMMLPLMVPFLFATLRICLGVAWKVMLTAELFGGTSGFGHVISRARANLDTPTIFAVIVIIVALVYITDKFMFEPLNLRMRRNYAVA